MQKLEAIILNITSNEIDTNIFKTFLTQFSDMKYTDIDCVIYINNRNHTMPLTDIVTPLATVFAKVEVFYLNIDPKDDVYIKYNQEHIGNYLPKYGYISGPNIMFLHAMRKSRKYNTVLLLECDCLLKQSFITDLEMFTRFSGGFLIAGTCYDGFQPFDPLSVDSYHVNGVALYHTGSPVFQTLIDDLDEYIKVQCKTSPRVPFDTALYRMVSSNVVLNPRKWKLILRNIIRTTFIMNLSVDKDAEVEYDKEYYNRSSVIHIKFNNIKMHFPRGFLIQKMVE